ncbi:MAG: EAL domain-containing protein [Muribaculaceae bacterium]|nr:EAL domain-containing protein [Muribaculaceae bacterium]MCM1493138.1 EAL domain-containing protein [Muribaculaceae bacterium]
MPIHNQLCGLAVMAMLLYMFLRQRRIGLYTERVFLRTLIILIVCVGLDALSIVAITYRDSISDALLAFICKSYVVSLVWVGYLALTYIMTDLYVEQEYYRKIHTLTWIVSLESLVVYCLPIRYHVEGNEMYTEGPCILMTYVFAFSFLLATICMILYYRKRIESKRRLAALMWMGIWLLAAFVQFLNNQWLLVGFAGSLGMLALYCILENPENNIDHKLGCFHHHALIEYLNQCYGRGVSKSILFLSINNRQRRNIGMEPADIYLRRLIEWFRGDEKVMIFKNADKELAVVFPDMTALSHAFSKIQETFYYNQFYNIERGERKREEYIEEFPETLFILFPDTSLVRDADELMQVHQALYVEHCNRADSLVCYVNQQALDKIRQEDQIVQEIKKALREDRVEVFYQPIYDVREQRFSSAEALVRIRKRDGSLMSPGLFIPVAEANGLIDKLGERVFEKVCAFLKQHDPGELGIHYLEVNLSVVQCEQRNLADRYLEIMRRYETSPWYINLEITETGTLLSKKTLLGNMNRLIREGVSFSLDDFGNGQSNLDYMIDMPVSVMKLDMNMTRAYFEDMKAKMVVQAAIQMAHDLDLFIVAEGVETEEQFTEMAKRKVDYIQGYYFSKPLPEEEYVAFLHARRQPAAGGGS